MVMSEDVGWVGARCSLVEPVGRLDVTCSEFLRAVLGDAIDVAGGNVVVDLIRVPSIDQESLAVLSRALEACRQHGGTLILCGVRDQAMTVLADTGDFLLAPSRMDAFSRLLP